MDKNICLETSRNSREQGPDPTPSGLVHVYEQQGGNLDKIFQYGSRGWEFKHQQTFLKIPLGHPASSPTPHMQAKL